jgi:hypothetical protein
MPPPAIGGEAATGKADDHHSPDWRFRDGGQRSNFYGGKYKSGAAILSFAVSREDPLR